MEKRQIIILLAILGGIVLIFLNHPIFLTCYDTLNGYVTEFILRICGLIGLVSTIIFSTLLIIDAIRYLYKTKQ